MLTVFHNNFFRKHAVKGWELFAVVASLFTPSPDFRDYISHYFQTSANLKDEIGPRAAYALKRLGRTFVTVTNHGGRRYVPGTLEVKACLDAKPILVRVSL